MNKLILPGFILLLFISDIHGMNNPGRVLVQMSLKDYQVVTGSASNLFQDNLDVIAMDRRNGLVQVLMTPAGETILLKAGVDWALLKDAGQLRDDRDIDTRYLDYNDVTSALNTMQSTHPSIVHVIPLGTTYENRTIWGVKISDNVMLQEEEPEILFLGLHEAREIMGTEITMDIVTYLADNYGSDPDVTNWVNTWQIWVVPMLNPDGSAYCWSTDPYWIKNRHDLGGDVFGVALGHNYPLDWGTCFGSSSDPNSNGYRGPSPGSETEIQSILTLAGSHKFLAMISYHSFDEYILHPYGCSGEIAPEDSLLNSFANSISSRIQTESGSYGYMAGSWWELLYSNDGNETDYFYALQGSMAIAVETNASSYYPDYSIATQTVTRNRAGWQEALNLFETGWIVQGTITDACTGSPVAATYSFQEYPLTPKESLRQNNPVTGYYAAIGRSGALTLVVEADGYIAQRVPVQFITGPVTRNITMLPVNRAGLDIWAAVVHDESGDADAQLDPGETVYLDIAIWAPGLAVTGISAIMTTTDPYITILDDSGDWPNLPPGGGAYCTSNRFRVSAASETPENHLAELVLTFNANQTLCDDDASTTVLVRSINYLCPFWEETMDSDPFWLVTSYPTSGSPAGPYHNWEFGQPVNGPGTAYTGQYVYGTDLDGLYDNNWTLCLTSPILDCSNATDVSLQFAQYYDVESGWDNARVRIRNDGGSWITILDEDGSTGGWLWRELDISTYADGEPEVELRFDVRADNSVNGAGHYIDDVRLCGMAAGAGQVQPTPTLPPTSTPTPVATHTPTPSPTSECLHNGDVTLDGEVTAGDAQRAFLIALGLYAPTYTENCAADCNADSEITAGDAQGIFILALGGASCADSLPV